MNRLIFSMEDFNELFQNLDAKLKEKKFVVSQLDNVDYAAGVLQGMNYMLDKADSLFVELWNKKALEHNSALKKGGRF